jgi:hypothetical protein
LKQEIKCDFDGLTHVAGNRFHEEVERVLRVLRNMVSGPGICVTNVQITGKQTTMHLHIKVQRKENAQYKLKQELINPITIFKIQHFRSHVQGGQKLELPTGILWHCQSMAGFEDHKIL